jgi:hypothetical protein
MKSTNNDPRHVPDARPNLELQLVRLVLPGGAIVEIPAAHIRVMEPNKGLLEWSPDGDQDRVAFLAQFAGVPAVCELKIGSILTPSRVA